MTIMSDSATETEATGEIIGSHLKGGEVIELISDLGGGKTTLVRGLVRGAGSDDHVSSPTFTVSKVYVSSKLTIHHFDFYRLNEAGLMEHELEDKVHDSNNVIVVEWGKLVNNTLPKNRLKIEIVQTGNDSRELILNYPALLSYLLEKA